MVKYKKVKREDIFHKDYEIALDFATQTYKQFSEIIKTIVLFGSVSKQEAQKKSDIDIIILIDDCTIEWDQELISWYRTELAKLISKQRYKDKIHINTITLSTFWEELRAGEPLIINILRYGQTLIDFGGFFEPLKILLAKGRIRSTPEAVFTTMKRAPEHLIRSNASLLGTIEGFYQTPYIEFSPIHHDIYGSKFSTLPTELGGQVGGGEKGRFMEGEKEQPYQ